MKLLIVIVCYKVVDLTISCLRALEPEVAALPGTKVGLCENGTGGDAYERLDRAIRENGWDSWVDLTSVTPNRGFTGGNNHVIRPAIESEDPPEYVLLLNADTEVRPGALRVLIDFMDAHQHAGVAGSQLFFPDGRVHPSPFLFEGIASQFNRGAQIGLITRLLRHWVVPPRPTGAALAQWIAGASMIVRREVFEKIGLLDEDYYTYFDDIDFCLNTWRAGWEVWYVPASKVIHLVGQSTDVSRVDRPRPKRRPDYWFEARRHFFLKNYGRFYTALVDAAQIGGLMLGRLRRLVARKPELDPPSILSDSIRHSVFFTGFKLRPVINPAIKPPPSQMISSVSQGHH